MSLQVVILGSGGTIPTIERNLPAVAIKRMGEVFLIDCGEGTQRQYMKSKLGFGKLKSIFISHYHADHVLGLPGLLMTLNLMGFSREITIYGPKGIELFLESVMSLINTELHFSVKPVQLNPGIVVNCKDYQIRVDLTDHGMKNFGFAFVENERFGRVDVNKVRKMSIPEGPLIGELQRGKSIKLENGQVIKPEEIIGPPRRGRKVVVAIDTRPCESVVKLAQGADLLVYDGMFLNDLKEEAQSRGHSTLEDGALIARKADVKQLVYTHISPRYLSKHKLLQEQATQLFKNSIVAKDLQRIEVEYVD